MLTIAWAGVGNADNASAPVGWRNDGSGHFPNANPPLEWSETKNILWKTTIGPNRYSSPVVVGGKVFVTADPAILFCVDAADGKILWQQSNGPADLPEKDSSQAPPATPDNTTSTPASDGKNVYVVLGNGIAACYDVSGRRQWIRYFDLKPTSQYGRAASPVLADGKLFVTLSHLMALDPTTGREVWTRKEVPESFGTPMAAKIDETNVLVMPSGHLVRSSDGMILAAMPGGLKFASPIVRDDTVYLIQTGSISHRFTPASPDRWLPKPLWEQEIPGTYYASALIDNGLIYAVANELKFSILDARDGTVLVTRELAFPNVSDDVEVSMYPSLTLAGNRLFVFNDQGDALVLEPGNPCRELKRNHLGEGHGGSPAFVEKRIYIRSGRHLYCIGEK